MDDRDQPDTNVVRLRRRGDPGEAERKLLASTIFAEEDEVGTFSRGNLVPPKQSADGDEQAPAAPDPFFDELQNGRSVSSASAEAEPVAPESTAAYFDQIDSETPAEMSEGITVPAARSAMPGSAHLPGDIVKPSRRRRLPSARRKARPKSDERTPSYRVALWRRARTFARELLRLPRRLRARTAQLQPARLTLAVGIALLLAVGTGVATVVATQVSGGTSVKRSAAHRDNRARLAMASRGNAAIGRLAVRTRPRHKTSHAKSPIRHRAVRHTPPPAPTHTTAAVASAPTTAAVSTGSTQQPVTQSPPAGGGTSTAQPSSSSSDRSSFGANGILGPGHSPNG